MDREVCPDCGTPKPAERGCPRCLMRAAFARRDDLLALIPENWDLPEDLQFIGDYLVTGPLGAGAMGEVFRGRDVRTHRTVAIKILKSGAPDDRFRQEIRTLGTLDHPGIIKVLREGVHEGRPWFAMDYVEGTSLAVLAGGQPLPPPRAVRHLAEVARALHYAHQRGILHRDVKPSNILIDGLGQARLADFGLAKALDAPSDLTHSGQTLGTPAYMAPEQTDANGRHVCPRADVYGLGATLYQLLTGVPPFRAENVTALLRMIVDQEPASPRALNGAVDRDLETLCLKCLQKDPRHRYASAQEVADECERWLDRRPIRARPLSTVARLVKWTRRRPALAAALSLAVLFLVLGLAGVLWQWRRAEARRAETVIASHHKAVGRAQEMLALGQGREAFQLLTEALHEDPNDTLVAQRLHAALVQHPLARRRRTLPHPPGATWIEAAFGPTAAHLVLLDSERRAWLQRDLPEPPLVPLADHQPVTTLPVFLPDGAHAICLLETPRLTVIDVANGKSRHVVPLAEPAHQVVLTPQGDRGWVILPSGGQWLQSGPDFEAYSPTTPLAGITQVIHLPGPNVFVACASNGLYHLEPHRSPRRLPIPVSDELTEIRAAPDGRSFLISDGDGLRLARANGDLQTTTLPRVVDAPLAWDYAADGRHWVAIGRSPTWFVLREDGAERVRSIPAHSRPISIARMHPSRLWTTTGSDDGTVRVWSTIDGSPRSDVLDFGAPVREAVLDATGEHLCVLTLDGRGELWDLPRRPPALHPHPLPAPTRDTIMNSAGLHLVQTVADSSGTAGIRRFAWYDVAGGRAQVQTNTVPLLLPLQFASRGPFGVAATVDAGAWVFPENDLSHGFEIPGPFGTATLSPGGDLVAGQTPAGVSIWSTAQQKEVAVRTLPALERIERLQFTETGTHLAFWGPRGPVVLGCSDSSRKELGADTENPPDLWQLSSRGKWFAWARAERRFVVATGVAPSPDRVALRTTAGSATALAFSPDETRLAVGDAEGRVRLLSLASLQPIGIPMRHLKAINSLDFTADGRFLATASADETVRIWDTATGLAVVEPVRSPEVYGVRFSRDDRYLISATGMRWEYPRWVSGRSEDLLAAAAAELRMDLAPHERAPSLGIPSASPLAAAASDLPLVRWLANHRTTQDQELVTPNQEITWGEYRRRRRIAATYDPSSCAILLEIAETDPTPGDLQSALREWRERDTSAEGNP